MPDHRAAALPAPLVLLHPSAVHLVVPVTPGQHVVVGGEGDHEAKGDQPDGQEEKRQDGLDGEVGV
eukprot:CAMPEP_0177759872 /NCGR_PEP_ID=MMETSP0491_2-20121128/4961_1 /TAXON_ID=63592 /ORGANISM="Tetraselmis chuii, Strain PLY429" /LENGTH=65 /DNA_ID=CAMNT_0019275725 /DNA_START=176 /DNA_END=373 /DNA_ORIENTATION=+